MLAAGQISQAPSTLSDQTSRPLDLSTLRPTAAWRAVGSGRTGRDGRVRMDGSGRTGQDGRVGTDLSAAGQSVDWLAAPG